MKQFLRRRVLLLLALSTLVLAAEWAAPPMVLASAPLPPVSALSGSDAPSARAADADAVSLDALTADLDARLTNAVPLSAVKLDAGTVSDPEDLPATLLENVQDHMAAVIGGIVAAAAAVFGVLYLKQRKAREKALQQYASPPGATTAVFPNNNPYGNNPPTVPFNQNAPYGGGNAYGGGNVYGGGNAYGGAGGGNAYGGAGGGNAYGGAGGGNVYGGAGGGNAYGGGTPANPGGGVPTIALTPSPPQGSAGGTPYPGAAGTPTLCFSCRGGYYDGQRIPIHTDIITIGRARSNTITFPENYKAVSRKHAIVRVQNGVMTIEDISSAGTYLKRTRARLPAGQQVPINVGDVFYLGEQKNRFEVARL